jgi:tripartite-type tricarboxylate transporter receptor subunit TctC
VAERLMQLGALPVANTPEEFLAFTKSEYAKFGKLVKDAGMLPE